MASGCIDKADADQVEFKPGSRPCTWCKCMHESEDMYRGRNHSTQAATWSSVATWTAISSPRAQELFLNESDKVRGTPIMMFRALVSPFDLAAVAFALERAVMSTGFRHLYMKATGSGKHICRVKQLTAKVIMCSCCQVGDAVCSQSLLKLICGTTQISRYKSGMKRDHTSTSSAA